MYKRPGPVRTRPGLVDMLTYLPGLVVALVAVALLIVVVGQYVFFPAPAGPSVLSSSPLSSYYDAVQGSTDRNPLYATGKLQGDCPAPEADDTRSRPDFFDTVADCMDRSWHAPFASLGMDFSPPVRVFWTKPGRGPCGDYPGPWAAYYCRGNHGIYFPRADDGDRTILTAVLAHEYGHHVQETAGIFEAARNASGSDEAAVLLTSRRSELQAYCFAGVWFAAVRRSFPVSPEDWEAVLMDTVKRGDPDHEGRRTHGKGENGAAWMNGGFVGGKPGHCNTWTAPAAEVD